MPCHRAGAGLGRYHPGTPTRRAIRTDRRSGPTFQGEPMSNRTPEVDRFLAELDHPLQGVVADLRATILNSDDRITEQIKWKAPSFCFAGDDRVTMNLRRQDAIQLIFHRGVKVRDSSSFVFEDPTGLLKWASPDRGILTVASLDDLRANRAEIVGLVDRWMDATTDRPAPTT